MHNSNEIITIKDLHKSFDGRKVLDGIHLSLSREENLVVLGQSGGGKSVLIKCIVGLLKADQGEIIIEGKMLSRMNTSEINTLRQKIGFSFQGSALYDSMTVQENLEFPLRRNKRITNKKLLSEQVKAALEDVGMFSSLKKMPSQLSGGMRKRIGIARILIMEPEIIMYDEPTAGLDPITSIEINELILKVKEKNKNSAIIITHDLACAKTTGNKIVYLKNGKILQEGSYSELEMEPAEESLKTFFNYYKC